MLICGKGRRVGIQKLAFINKNTDMSGQMCMCICTQMYHLAINCLGTYFTYAAVAVTSGLVALVSDIVGARSVCDPYSQR